MLAHDRSGLLVLLWASFYCPNVAFCSMSKAFATVLIVKN